MLLLDDHEGTDTDLGKGTKKKDNQLLSEIAEEDDVSTVSE
jgi:hypothetical protein